MDNLPPHKAVVDEGGEGGGGGSCERNVKSCEADVWSKDRLNPQGKISFGPSDI